MSDPAVLARPNPNLGTCKLSSVLGLRPLIELYGDVLPDPTAPTAAPAGPITDPMVLFEREEAAKAAGDVGVEVRQAAASASAEVSRIAAETRGPLGIERTLFVNNGKDTEFAGWMSAISAAADSAYEVCAEVRVAGLEISAAFKSRSAEQSALETSRDGEIARMQTALATFRSAIARVTAAVHEARKSVEGALEFYEEKFLDQYEATTDGIRNCLMWDYPEAPALDAKAKAIHTRAYELKTQAGFEEALGAASLLVTEASALVRKYDDAYHTELERLEQIVQGVQDAIDQHASWIPFLGNDLTEEHKTLTQGKIDAAMAMANSGRNMRALAAAITVANEARLMIDAIDDPQAKATLKTTNDDIKVIANTITRFKAKRPNDAKLMQKALDDVTSEIRGLAPDDARERVSALMRSVTTSASPGDWTTYQGRGQLQETWEADFTRKADALETEVAQLDSLVSGGAYTGTLVAKLKALRALVAAEANETTGAEAQALTDEIDGLLARYRPALSTDPTDATAADAARGLLVADQAEAIAAAERQAQDKAAFERLYVTVKEKADAAPSDTDFAAMIRMVATAKADYDTALQMLAAARTTADAASDFRTAHSLTETVAKDLEKLHKRATGELFDDLRKMGRVWQIGALDFASKIAELEQAMRDAVETMDDPDEQAARRTQVTQTAAALKDLVAFFPQNAFDDMVVAFAINTDAKSRKRNREEVLRRVRLYRDAITGDPVMKSIVSNPFGVSGIAVTMYAQLRKIELMTLATV